MNQIPDVIHDIERRLHELRRFTADLEDIKRWSSETRTILEARHAASATSTDEQDSIIVDPQVGGLYVHSLPRPRKIRCVLCVTCPYLKKDSDPTFGVGGGAL